MRSVSAPPIEGLASLFVDEPVPSLPLSARPPTSSDGQSSQLRVQRISAFHGPARPAPADDESLSIAHQAASSDSTVSPARMFAGDASTTPAPAVGGDCPDDITDMVKYLVGDGGWGQRWLELIAVYVEIERRGDAKSQVWLPKATENRPPEVAQWMKCARRLQDVDIKDLDAFAQHWWAWWRVNQPATRQLEETSPEAAVPDAAWSQLAVTGPSGIVLFLVTSVWWGAAISEASAQHQQAWLDAIEDMLYVFKGVLRSFDCGDGPGTVGQQSR